MKIDRNSTDAQIAQYLMLEKIKTKEAKKRRDTANAVMVFLMGMLTFAILIMTA